MRHLIRPNAAPGTHPADVPCTVIHMHTRGHKTPVRGRQCRSERDELARIVGPGLLADLLRSGRPLTVNGYGADAWELKEWPDEPAENQTDSTASAGGSGG